MPEYLDQVKEILNNMERNVNDKLMLIDMMNEIINEIENRIIVAQR